MSTLSADIRALIEQNQEYLQRTVLTEAERAHLMRVLGITEEDVCQLLITTIEAIARAAYAPNTKLSEIVIIHAGPTGQLGAMVAPVTDAWSIYRVITDFELVGRVSASQPQAINDTGLELCFLFLAKLAEKQPVPIG